MPIKKYHTREIRDVGPPVLGRLRKGMSKEEWAGKGKKGYPPELEYFRIDWTSEPDKGKFQVDVDRANAAWFDLYGGEPKVIENVYFHTDSIDLIFNEWMEEWAVSDAGNALCTRRCDGEFVVFQRAGNAVSRDPVACTHQCKCRPNGQLKFWLPEFDRAYGFVGQFMLLTHGQDDLDRIRSELNRALNWFGGLRNIGFRLYRSPTRKMTPDGKYVVKNDVYLEMMEAWAQKLALVAGDNALMLTSGNGSGVPLLTVGKVWADSDSIRRLRDMVQLETIDDMQYSEMCRLAGISKNADVDTWNRMFTSFEEAKSTIIAKFQTELTGD